MTSGPTLYSAGSTLHTLIAGRPPFWRADDESLNPLLIRLLHEPAPPLPAALAPDDLVRLVLRTLAKNPGDRPPSCRAFADELAAIAARAGAATVPTPLPGPATWPAPAQPVPRAEPAPAFQPAAAPWPTPSQPTPAAQPAPAAAFAPPRPGQGRRVIMAAAAIVVMSLGSRRSCSRRSSATTPPPTVRRPRPMPCRGQPRPPAAPVTPAPPRRPPPTA